jgi:hypothetical protein
LSEEHDLCNHVLVRFDHGHLTEELL